MQHTSTLLSGKIVELVTPSPREQGLLLQLLLGRTNKEIAARLNLAEGTVKVYFSWLIHETGVGNRAELGVWVRSNPQIFRRLAVRRGLHAAGCDCGSPHCGLMQLAESGLNGQLEDLPTI